MIAEKIIAAYKDTAEEDDRAARGTVPRRRAHPERQGSRGERRTPAARSCRSAAGCGLHGGRLRGDPGPEELIVTTLEQWADALHLDLIVTTGGTGVAPTDRTPEATRRVIATEVPGLAEAMRQASLKKTVQAVWSRGIAGIRGTCLIVNLPGSRKAARENLEAVLPALAHGIDKLQGGQADCGQPD